MKLELISFKICPFVQRSVITLNYKKVPYDLTYIELENPPVWLDQISPMGKVPVLRVNQETAIFESAVINEYLDEVLGTPLHPKDPLRKAFERAWIEYGSELIMSLYGLALTTEEKQMQEAKTEFFADLERLESILNPNGPYFRGTDFSLVDAAYAPLFTRIFISKVLNQDSAWKKMPRVRKWGEALLTVPAVKESVTPDFEKLHIEYIKKQGSLIF